MKKAAIYLMLVIFMIGNSVGQTLKPGDTATLQNGGRILNASEYDMAISDYTDFGQIHISSGDSLLMNGVWVKNLLPTPVAMRVELHSFEKIFAETVELNKDRFADVNLIQPGDSVVLFPRYVGGPYEVWTADSVQNLGKHDCMWRICERYRAGELKTSPIVLELISAIDENNEATGSFNWLGWILLFLGFILLAGVIYWLVRRVLEEASRNADNHPPVIPGGLSDDDQIATQQIQTRLPEGSRVAKLERGKLKRWFGPKKVLTIMNFSDLQRPAYIHPGENVVRVTIEDANGLQTIQYWRSHCGNAFSIVARDNFVLPEGWTFELESTTTPQASSETANAEGAEPISQPITDTSAAPAPHNGHPTEPKNELSNFDKFLNSIPKEHISGIKFTDSEEYGVSVNVKYNN